MHKKEDEKKISLKKQKMRGKERDREKEKKKRLQKSLGVSQNQINRIKLNEI